MPISALEATHHHCILGCAEAQKIKWSEGVIHYQNNATVTRSPRSASLSIANRLYANFAPVVPHRWCLARNSMYCDLDSPMPSPLRLLTLIYPTLSPQLQFKDRSGSATHVQVQVHDGHQQQRGRQSSGTTADLIIPVVVAAPAVVTTMTRGGEPVCKGRAQSCVCQDGPGGPSC
jgi:hypothetical protein